MKKYFGLLLGLLALDAGAASRNIPLDTAQFTRQGSAPSSPVASTVYAYVLDSDGKFYVKNSAGTANFCPYSGTIVNADLNGSAGITNANLNTMANGRFKCRTSSGTGLPEDCTGAEATALLSAFVGDSGSGGTKGLVPAPAAGDAADDKFLHADGTWKVPAGSGGTSGSAVIETPAACTVVPIGFGTVTADSFICTRVGKFMQVSGGFTGGTLTSFPIGFRLPGLGAYTIDYSDTAIKASTSQQGEDVGNAATDVANENVWLLSNVSSSLDIVWSGRTFNVASHMIPAAAQQFSNSVPVRLKFLVPIHEWSANTVSSGTIQGDCAGGSLSSSGDYDICEYDTVGSHTFTFSSEVGDALYDAEAIGGGGSGGAGSSGGGGGSGAFCRGMGLSAANGTISITIGDKGAGANGAVGNNGTDTVFGSTTAKGGGKGGYADGSANANGSDGGAGGGGGDDSTVNPGGATTQGTTSGDMQCYGYAGGTNYGASPFNAGGGGSSLEYGETVGTAGGGKGGRARISAIDGNPYAAGGGGGAGASGGSAGAGGTGGGGQGGNPTVGCEGGDATTHGSGGGGVGRSCSGTTIAGDGMRGKVLMKWKAR